MSEKPPATPRMTFKITVLGDGGVGKTALTVQFTMSSFIETYDPTIEDCYRKQWVVDDQPCLLEVLDTAGQEEYTALRDQWIRDGEGFIVVYAVTSRSTYDRVERIVERILRVKEETPSSSSLPPNSPRHRIPIVIVGNKKDKYQEREVSTEEAKTMAQQLGCDFYETSAKTNVNVESAFKSVVRQIQGGRKGLEGGGSGVVGAGSGIGGGGKKKKRCVIL